MIAPLAVDPSTVEFQNDGVIFGDTKSSKMDNHCHQEAKFFQFEEKTEHEGDNSFGTNAIEIKTEPRTPSPWDTHCGETEYETNQVTPYSEYCVVQPWDAGARDLKQTPTRPQKTQRKGNHTGSSSRCKADKMVTWPPKRDSESSDAKFDMYKKPHIKVKYYTAGGSIEKAKLKKNDFVMSVETGLCGTICDIYYDGKAKVPKVRIRVLVAAESVMGLPRDYETTIDGLPMLITTNTVVVIVNAHIRYIRPLIVNTKTTRKHGATAWYDVVALAIDTSEQGARTTRMKNTFDDCSFPPEKYARHSSSDRSPLLSDTSFVDRTSSSDSETVDIVCALSDDYITESRCVTTRKSTASQTRYSYVVTADQEFLSKNYFTTIPPYARLRHETKCDDSESEFQSSNESERSVAFVDAVDAQEAISMSCGQNLRNASVVPKEPNTGKASPSLRSQSPIERQHHSFSRCDAKNAQRPEKTKPPIDEPTATPLTQADVEEAAAVMMDALSNPIVSKVLRQCGLAERAMQFESVLLLRKSNDIVQQK